MSNADSHRPIPKIAVVAGCFPARSETFVREHVLGLARKGYRISVISCGASDGIQDSELAEVDSFGVERITVHCFGSQRFQNLIQLLKATTRYPQLLWYFSQSSFWTRREMCWAYEVHHAIKKLKPDIVHVHFGAKAAPLSLCGLSKPTAITWHGYDANCVPKKKGKGLYEELFSRSFVHTVGSEFMRQRLQKLGADDRQITRIPMGIDTDYFAYKSRPSSAVEPLQIISVGRLDEMKGHTFLIQAVSELMDEDYPIELRIIGDGPQRETLSAQIESTQHLSKIHLLGAKNKHSVLAELHAASLFCLTGVIAKSGRIESQGIVFAEAQATGLPVIGSSIGGIPASLIEGETGLLCPPGDVASIKQAILFFLENRQAINEFGLRGRMFVESHFKLKAMVDAFEDVYKLCLQKSKHSSMQTL